MARTFKCEACGGTFEADWADAERDAESKELWGDLEQSEKAEVCDDCFKEFMAWHGAPAPQEKEG